MQVSYNWLQEYVDINLSPKELAHQLTLAGIAVDAVDYSGEGIDNVVVGHITKITSHPNADKLVVCQVDVGKESVQIVTGAPNVQEDAKVAVALVGAVLPGGTKIKKAKLRGESSAGMMCSAKELGLDPKNFPEEQREGIIILPDDVPVGEDIKSVLGLDDYILVLDLTPNRADCMSMLNVAREVAAITGGAIKLPNFQVDEASLAPADEWAKVRIDAQDLCQRYVARVITDVTISPSPLWMQHRLNAAGVRPINNVVDVTNYIMMELGQPMHAFDYDKLEEHRIVVRKAVQGEKITTLDEDQYELDADMLVIADARRPVAVAGVMGGLETEVTAKTQTILLESAYFEGISIRRTSRKLGLRSESSSRFEKGIDKEASAMAADRAAQLLMQVSGGKVVPGSVDAYPRPWSPTVIQMSCDRVNQLLGTDISGGRMQEMLASLSLEVKQLEGALLEIRVPSYRGDLTAEIDLVEEIARLYGYDNIKTNSAGGRAEVEDFTPEQKLRKKVTETVLGCGLNEIITYSFISPKSMDRLMVSAEHNWRKNVVVQNPLSEEQSVMRTTLLPGLLETASKNFKRRQTDLALFEIGSVFQAADTPLPDERQHIGVVVSGEAARGWMSKPEQMDFFYAKGIVEEILQQLGVKEYWFQNTDRYPSLHPGRSAEIMVGGGNSGGSIIGYLGEVHPNVLDNYGLQQRAAVVELYLSGLIDYVNLVPTYQALPKFPAMVRDMAVVIPENYQVAEVDAAIMEAGGNLLKKAYLFDVYTGKQIAEGYQSLAYSMKYQADDRTLTDEEVSQHHQRIQETLRKKFDAQLR